MALDNASHACDVEVETGALLASDGEEVTERRGQWGAKLVLLAAASALVLTAAGGAFFASGRLAIKVHKVAPGGAPAGLISEEGVCGAVTCPVGEWCVTGVCQVAPAPVSAPPSVAAAVPPVPPQPAAAAAAGGAVPCSTVAKTVRTNPNKRSEALNDGNVCRDSEELFGGLCYKKCSSFPGYDCQAKRISAFQCCKTNCDDPLAALNVFGDVESLEPCTGFDVSSADAKSAEGPSCPHEPGACMENEEQNNGVCFKKCSVLTGGTMPFRCAADTCSATNPNLDPFPVGIAECIADGKTDDSFNVGGGAGDGDKSTPAESHGPSTEETESSK